MVLALAGCGGHGAAHAPARAGNAGVPLAVELTATPFFPQEAYQCGPAALATVLRASGVDVSPGELTPQLYLPKRRGSLQLELLAASRRHGRLPYPIEGGPAELVAELEGGRPVLVMQNIGLALWPVWHYAVVVGLDEGRDEYLLRSGGRERLAMAGSRFLRSWRLADHWGLVILRPGELPARPDRTRYLKAVAALEGGGQPAAARVAYRAALEQWPGEAVARLGLGNVALALGEAHEAEGIYRQLLDDDPGNASARNNLAQALAEQGCYSAALHEIDRARAQAGEGAPLAEVLAQTRSEIVIRAAQEGGEGDCRGHDP